LTISAKAVPRWVPASEMTFCDSLSPARPAATMDSIVSIPSCCPARLLITPFRKADRTLSMIEEQYHLAMLESELANRAYVSRFRRSTVKLAFLPHCLRDMSRDCKSAPDDHDSVCMGCSARCWINGISSLLRDHGVLPYIWLRSDLGALFRSVRKDGVDVAVLGIACVPELAWGIALCMRHQVPVIGLPLNANRCARWTGEFKTNSVDLEQLVTLLRG